ncbi:MAG: DUF1343 domain-containing protein [Gemmatimonadetes bacterium]|nr:DUF1343 domain-containing protein [Gemmatimonadota bacterium]
MSVLLLAVTAACGERGAAQRIVRPGIEVLLADSLHLLRDARVGILTNQTGVDRSGKSDVDLLRQARVQVTAIFSPEHGFRGNQDRENIENAVDSATGVPIYSLYGTVRAPTREMLAGVDVLVVDLQDIGARPYTYVSTALLALRAAREMERRVIVLDRPNPIGGELVQGPVLDTALGSFVGILPVPLRHGLTLGELARFGNDVLGIHADLAIVPAAGWQRGDWFDATGLPWIRPSPNMPDLESATHYPGLVLLEGTNLSVGRGTPIAFQVIGAPWLEPQRVVGRLASVPGVSYQDTLIMPQQPGDGKYAAEEIPAIRLRVTRRGVYDPTHLAVALLSAVRTVHRDSLKIDPRAFDQRAGNPRLRRGLERDHNPNRIWNDWRAGTHHFLLRRDPYLLYR